MEYLSETWFENTVNDVDIVVRCDWDKHGEEVWYDVRNDIAFTARPAFKVLNDTLTFVDVLLPKAKPTDIQVIY